MPSNQECWQEATAAQGRLLVVEIMERQEVSDAEAASFFFRDLGESNGCDVANSPFTAQPPIASSGAGAVVQGLPTDAVVCFGSGHQRVAKGRDTDIAGNPREQQVETIQIELCLIRLPSQTTDLLITLSSPVQDNVDSTVLFRRILSTFQIRNWGLFG